MVTIGQDITTGTDQVTGTGRYVPVCRRPKSRQRHEQQPLDWEAVGVRRSRATMYAFSNRRTTSVDTFPPGIDVQCRVQIDDGTGMYGSADGLTPMSGYRGFALRACRIVRLV